MDDDDVASQGTLINAGNIGGDASFRTVLMDPPWKRESGGGQSKRGADRHYGLLSNDEVVRVVQMNCPHWPDVADSAHLWLWCTNPTLAHGDVHEVARKLGFAPKTVFTWVKVAPAGLTGETETPVDQLMGCVQRGLGQYSMGSTEHLVLCTRGDFMKPDKRHPTVFFAPREEHSVKPETSYELVEQTSPGDYLEIFARRPRDGWRVWGDEIDDETQSIADDDEG